MNVRELRGWLLQQPKPDVVRVTDGEGAQHQIETSGLSWVRIADSVAALQPQLVEALNKKGTLIRACRPELDSDDDDDDSSSTRSKPKKPTPATPPAPTVADLEPFARMLADAYKHSTSLAFDKLVELYNASNERLLALERMQQRELERKEAELEQREAELEEQAEQQQQGGSGDIVQDMIGAFVGGAGGSTSTTPAPAPAPNGAPTNGAKSGARPKNGKA